MVFPARRMRSFFFFDRSHVWQSHLLQGNNFHLQSTQFHVDDSYLAHVVYFLMSSEKPGVIVRTFQVPNFRAEVFLWLLHGAGLSICLSAFTLNPTHPVRLTEHGEVALTLDSRGRVGALGEAGNVGATNYHPAGRKWPLGRMFETPHLDDCS